MLPSDLLHRRETHFTFWLPSLWARPPVLVIGTFAAGNPNTLANRKDIPLSQADPKLPGLWAIAAADTGLPDGIYHYWFQVENTNRGEPALALIFCTDPFATTVDWRLLSPPLPAGFNNDTDRQPASVIRCGRGVLRRSIRAAKPHPSRPTPNRTNYLRITI
jgi:pullulanase